MTGDTGRIDFTEGTATYLSVLTSTYSGLTLEAYDANDNPIATSGWATNNLWTRTFTRLTVEAPPGKTISYVMVHDWGNYWLIDDLCTDAPGVPPAYKQVAELAKEVRGAPYLWGGKGYDLDIHRFEQAQAIKDVGYNYWNPCMPKLINQECKCYDYNHKEYREDCGPYAYNSKSKKSYDNWKSCVEKEGPENSKYCTCQCGGKKDFGQGLDCSGLSFWSYNQTYSGGEIITWNTCVEEEKCPLYYEGAHGQYKENTERIKKDELRVGDLLFFDVCITKTGKCDPSKKVNDNVVDHVAMYIGPFTYGGKEFNAIHASGFTGTVTPAYYNSETEELLTIKPTGIKQFLKVYDYGRVAEFKLAMEIIGKSPVNLIVIDPDGQTVDITNTLLSEDGYTREVDGMYYMIRDVDGDGDLEDVVAIPERKKGDYLIQVIPEPDALPTDTYSLEVTANGQTIILAENVPISEIPEQPYLIQSTETEIKVAPIANVNGPYEENEGSPITFNGSGSYDPDGTIVLYEWDLDCDGEYDDATGVNPSYTWGDDYSGCIGLKVTDNDGLISTATTTVNILNVPPVVEAGPDVSVQYSDSVQFNGSFTDPGWLDTHTIEWDFGDGERATGTLNPTHRYLVTPGNYTVALTVTDDDRGEGTDTAKVTVEKENVIIAVTDKEGFYDDTVTLGAKVLDDDGETLLQGPYQVAFKVDGKVIGSSQIDGEGNVKIEWKVDLIPKEIVENYPIVVSFAGNEYYNPAEGQGKFTLKSAGWLKQEAISELELAKTGEKKIDQKIDKIIKHIKDSLAKDLWIDTSHLVFFKKDCFDPTILKFDPDKIDLEGLFELESDQMELKTQDIFKGKCFRPKFGLRVFHEEYIATKLMLNELKGEPRIPEELKKVFKGVIGKLVKADTLLAKVSIFDAKNTPVQNPKFQKIVEKQIERAEKELEKAYQELEKGRPDKAVMRLSKSWLHSQLAIKFASLRI